MIQIMIKIEYIFWQKCFQLGFRNQTYLLQYKSYAVLIYFLNHCSKCKTIYCKCPLVIFIYKKEEHLQLNNFCMVHRESFLRGPMRVPGFKKRTFQTCCDGEKTCSLSSTQFKPPKSMPKVQLLLKRKCKHWLSACFEQFNVDAKNMVWQNKENIK